MYVSKALSTLNLAPRQLQGAATWRIQWHGPRVIARLTERFITIAVLTVFPR